ncbi:hypothetical protein GCM10027075_36700 [Streptomyces heilongjiangensis]
MGSNHTSVHRPPCAIVEHHEIDHEIGHDTSTAAPRTAAPGTADPAPSIPARDPALPPHPTGTPAPAVAGNDTPTATGTDAPRRASARLADGGRHVHDRRQ